MNFLWTFEAVVQHEQSKVSTGEGRLTYILKSWHFLTLSFYNLLLNDPNVCYTLLCSISSFVCSPKCQSHAGGVIFYLKKMNLNVICFLSFPAYHSNLILHSDIDLIGNGGSPATKTPELHMLLWHIFLCWIVGIFYTHMSQSRLCACCTQFFMPLCV